MTNLPLSIPPNHLSPPLAARVAGGGAIWLIGRVVLGGLFGPRRRRGVVPASGEAEADDAQRQGKRGLHAGGNLPGAPC